MSLAARMMGWQRRMGAVASPFAATGEPSNGSPVCVELLINGAWVDITSYVMTRDGGQKITISRGQSDEGASVERSSCSFQLNNRDGRFSPRNPTGPYYGKIGRNSTLRVSVPDNTYKNYRFWGEVTKWPQEWDLTGSDFWVNVEAYGPLSRLEKGRVPTHSVLYDALAPATLDSLLAYWPCEDTDETSTTIASVLPLGAPMSITGLPDLASYEFFRSSDPLPIMTDAMFSGLVSAYSPVTSCQVRFLLAVPVTGLDDGQVVASVWMDSLDVETWELYYVEGSAGEGQLALRPLDGDGATLAGGVTEFGEIRGKLLRVSVELLQNGANIDCTVRYLDLSNDVSTSGTGSLNAKTLTRVTKIEMAPAQVLGAATLGMADTAVGHVTLQNAITPITDLGAKLDPSGETAGRRFERICDDRNLSFDSIGNLDDTITMRAQAKLKPVDLLQQCVDVDGGIMYENLRAFGLGYRTRVSMYNQDPALSFSYEDNILSEVPTPIEDDRFIRNSIDVAHVDGDAASAHAELASGSLSIVEPPGGVGEYGESVSVNVNYDAQLADQAGWRLHMGTVDESRFPQISFNLARQQITPVIRSAILGLRPGDRILITDPPSTQATEDISLVVYGWASEEIDNFQHTLTLNCAPETPWRVGTSDDLVYARADTEGSVLVSDIASGATSMTVETTSGPYWTTSSAEFPFDVRMSGEVMTVTAISPYIYDTFTRSASSGWGTSDSGHAWSNAGGAASDFSVSSGKGRHLVTSVDVSRRTFVTAPTDDFDIVCNVTVDQLATGDTMYGGLSARYKDIDNLYHARVSFTTANTVLVDITKRLAGAETFVTSVYTTSITHVASQELTLRFQGIASDLKAKVWLATAAEPLEWQVTGTDGSHASGNFGTRSIRGPASTNVNPTFIYDEYMFNRQQTFTVTRSVNGVVKAQTAGADVRLAHPSILGL